MTSQQIERWVRCSLNPEDTISVNLRTEHHMQPYVCMYTKEVKHISKYGVEVNSVEDGVFIMTVLLIDGQPYVKLPKPPNMV